jgi:hypothetical protein
MHDAAFAQTAIADEARALLDRVTRLRPFVLQVPMVLAAGLSFDAQAAIEEHLRRVRLAMVRRAERFLEWAHSPAGRAATPAEVQQRFVYLRLHFNVVLTQIDIFAEAMAQRSEADTGVWLSGLDEVARDALRVPGLVEPPPVVCYLARGPGAAIRRARTRLPGGGGNPVAIVRLPRERMIGSGIASSLVHEVGHQGAALLDLVTTLRAEIAERIRRAGSGSRAAVVWARWSRWISEIVADFWAVARVGVTSTTGLIAVVSLPRAFVLRDNADDPHPTPWVRVKLSCAIGEALYPHEQWRRIAAYWESLYPLAGIAADKRAQLTALEAGLPALVSLLASHRPPSLKGRTLANVLASPERTPARLARLWTNWKDRPVQMCAAAPSLAFAVVGQARADRAIRPEDEGQLLADLLRHQAMRTTLDRTAVCAAPARLSKGASAMRLAVHATL